MEAINKTAVAADTLITGGKARLAGFSFKATADAEIIIRDGDNASGIGTVYIYLLNGQSVRETFGDINGVPFSEGMFVDVISGTVAGSVWWN